MEALRRKFPHHRIAEALRRRPNYHEALGIAQRFLVQGKIWLIGGQVYRTAAAMLYGRSMVNHYDFDFLLEQSSDNHNLQIPGWQRLRTGLGGIRLQRDTQQIDIVDLARAVHPADVSQVPHMSAQGKLESYLRYVPLTVQSIVYDTQTEKVHGQVGMQALFARSVAVLNLSNCQSHCHRHGFSPQEYIQQKAQTLGFQALPVENQ